MVGFICYDNISFTIYGYSVGISFYVKFLQELALFVEYLNAFVLAIGNNNVPVERVGSYSIRIRELSPFNALTPKPKFEHPTLIKYLYLIVR